MNRKKRKSAKTGEGFSPYGSQEARRCWNKIDKNHSNTKSALNRVGFARGYGFGADAIFLSVKTNERCWNKIDKNHSIGTVLALFWDCFGAVRVPGGSPVLEQNR